MKKARIFINAIPTLGEQTGIGNYTRQIARMVANLPGEFDATYYYGYRSRRAPDCEDRFLDKMAGHARRSSLLRRICKKALLLFERSADLVGAGAYDCYFEPNFTFYPHVRARSKVLAIHDFSCFLHPEWHPLERTRHMEKHFWPSVEEASKLVTVSETCRLEAIKIFNINPDLIVSIPNGVDHSFFKPAGAEEKARVRARYGLPPNFILYVGAIEPRKNLANLLRAYGSLPKALQKKFPLVLAGSSGWKNREITELVHEMGARFLGYARHEDLPGLYSSASLFAYVSHYEGFGLPVLEAMACGCPALISDCPALVELSGGACRQAQSDNVDSIRQCLAELLEDEDARTRMTAKGMERASMYSWEASGAKHASLFRSLAP